MPPAVPPPRIAPRAVVWREKPSTYVVCAEDLPPPEAQREFARRADRVVELPTGHHPMLSRPELLARVLRRASSWGILVADCAG
jgi:pimeloyl-ACP methyl ester carboxylesterase